MKTLQSTYSFFLFGCCCNIVLAKSPSVVIVGAGASGIAAATKLLENSITNITVLEAQNRIGGRIHTVPFANTLVDLGAQFCMGEEGNVVYEMVKDLDLLEHSKFKESNHIKVFTSDGTILDSNFTEDLLQLTDIDLKAATNASNFKDAFLQRFNSTQLVENYHHDSKLLTIRFLEQAILTYEGCYSWDQLATESHFVSCPGDQNLVWKSKGYHVILEVLMKSYPNPDHKLEIDDKILFNKEVTKIDWSGTQVTVQTCDKFSITADHVIFTPSVGVLKEKNLFDPQLPREKQFAIEAIGFDAIMKIFLHFPDKWWKKDDYVFMFIWTEEDVSSSSKDFPEGPSKDGTSWITHIPVFEKVSEEHNIFLMWISGDLIPQIETTSEDILLKGCNYLVRKFLGTNYNVTDADKSLRSQWRTNPYVRGSYSFEKAGYFKKDLSHHEKLSQPLVNSDGTPSVLFAGEATNAIHFGSVHGAIESGRREAERIVNLPRPREFHHLP